MLNDGNELLDSLFSPQSIAVVGASNKEGKMGNLFVKNLLSSYPGEIFLVHPTEKEILGRHTYPSISALPSRIDLVIPLIPASEVVKLVENCPVRKIKVLLAIPSGFGEVPGGGKLLENELITRAREREIRVVGPNSLGMFNCPSGLNGSMVPELPPGGPGFSCITQSGGYGMAIYMYAQDHHLEIAKFCDLGNTADVILPEFMDYFLRDGDTQVVGMYLESFGDPESFFTYANRLANEKPIVLTRLGRTHAGRRASFAHIGLQSAEAEIQEKIKSSRIIPAQTGLELLDIAKGLTWQPLPKGRRVGILTGAGGVGVELADLCLEHNLEVPEFSPRMQAFLHPYLPYYASVRNPVDLTPIWREYPRLYPPIIKSLFDSDEIDILLVTIIDVATTIEPLMNAIVETVIQVQKEGAQVKPIYIFWASPHNMRENRQILQIMRIPCYLSTLATVRVAAAICWYATRSKE